MKILHAITSLDKGGAENHLSILAKFQQKHKNNIFIFISKNSFYWINFLRKSGIKIYKSPTFNEKNFIFRLFKLYKDSIYLSKLIDNIKPEILHAHLPYMELVSYLSLYFSKHQPKFVITKHVDNIFFKGSDGQEKSVIGSIIVRKIAKKALKIIAISKAVKYFLASNYVGVEKKKIKIIRYGIDNLNSISRPEKKSKFKSIKSLKSNNLVIGCIARLVPQKSIDNILKSLSILKDKKIKLVIVGNGFLKKYLKNLSNQLDISDQIIWYDFIDDLNTFYQNINLFVLTSKYEGLGLVFLEAMLSKKPIICSNKSAMPEIVKNNYNGFLVDPDDPAKLAKAILKLKDKKLRYKLGLNGYKKIKKEFSVKKMYSETKKIYSLNEKNI